MLRRTHFHEQRSKLSLGLSVFALAAVVGHAAADPPVCEADPVYAGDLGPASPNDPPPQTSQGYFTSDINFNGDGDMAIIGELFGEGDAFGHGPGWARIYVLDGSWSQVAWLQHDDPVDNDAFGSSVDISGDFAIIAAPNRSDGEAAVGAVYFFENDSGWTQHTEILNPDGDPDAGFGGSLTRHETVALDDRLAAVAASEADVSAVQSAGKVYVYYYDSVGGDWELEATLTAPTPTEGESFGYSVDLDGTRVIIGAPAIGGDEAPGTAYIFKRTTPGGVPTWTLEGTLHGDNSDGDHFGWSVSIDGNAAAVGEPNTGKGHAYIFSYSALTSQWSEYAELTPSTSETSQGFGYNVCLSGSQVLVGAVFYQSTGTAYLWERAVGTWTEELQLTSTSANGGDRIGETLALRGEEAFVGSLGDDDPGTSGAQHGAVLIFSDVSSCDD